jgi:hypothetical protein
MFFEGYLTLDLDSAGIFRGIGIFCRFFALKDFLRNRPLKKVWADRPTAVRFRVIFYIFVPTCETYSDSVSECN